MSLGLNYKNNKHIFHEVEKETPYLSYPLFEETGLVKHGFSTRLGGVSEGYFASLNLCFDRGDDKEAVMENFRRIGNLWECAVKIWCFQSRLIRQMCVS